MMTKGDPEYRFFYPILTLIMDSFSCSLLNFAFFKKKAYAEMLHKRDDINLQTRSHTIHILIRPWKNSGNPDLVCKK